MKEKANKNKEKSVRIGDVLTAVALAVVGYSVYTGELLRSNDITASLATAAGAVSACIIFVLLLIRCKKAQSYRKYWLMAEYVILIAFLIVGYVLFAPQRHMQYISSNTENIKNAGIEDCQWISEGLFEEYDKKETDDIARIGISIETIPPYTQFKFKNDTIKEYLSKNGLDYNYGSVNTRNLECVSKNYKENLTKAILGQEHDSLLKSVQERVDNIKADLYKNPQYSEYWDCVKNLENLQEQAIDRLNSISKVPIKVTFRYEGKAHILDAEPIKNTYSGKELKIKKYFGDGKSGWTTLGACYSAILLLFVLGAYGAYPRKRRLTIQTKAKSNKNIGFDIV